MTMPAKKNKARVAYPPVPRLRQSYVMAIRCCELCSACLGKKDAHGNFVKPLVLRCASFGIGVARNLVCDAFVDAALE